MSILAIIVYFLVGASAVLAAIDAFMSLRGGRRPVTVAVAVVALVLLIAPVDDPASRIDRARRRTVACCCSWC